MSRDSRPHGLAPLLIAVCATLGAAASCTQSPIAHEQYPASTIAPISDGPPVASSHVLDTDYEFPLDQFPSENEILIRFRGTARIIKQWPDGAAVVRCFVNTTFRTDLIRFADHTPGWAVIGYISNYPSAWIYLGSRPDSDCAVAIQTDYPFGCTIPGMVPCTSTTDRNGIVSETWSVDVPVIATRECTQSEIFFVTPMRPYIIAQNMLLNTRGFLNCPELTITVDPWTIMDDAGAEIVLLTQR